jgi:pimeloyl-ACP methyl ester carboxylesterase
MDAVVVRDGIDLSVRDFGGAGVPVLLLHGAGNTLVDMVPLANHLLADHRVVAMDMRNHGRSGDGPWEWDEVLADVRAVIEQLELSTPAVVGHSLGGMVATLYADRHGEVVGAVNLDGHPLAPPAGSDSESARLRELLRSFADRTIRELSQPRTQQEVSAAREMWLAGALALGLDAPVAAEAFDRRLVASGNGSFTSRPGPARLTQLRDAMQDLDLLACYRRTAVPQLVYVAVGDGPDPNLPDELQALNAAHRKSVIEGLRQINDGSPHVRLVELEATHGLIYECPQLIADQIREFVEHTAAARELR